MGAFDDLIPGNTEGQSGAFDDLIPKAKSQNTGIAGDIGTALKRGVLQIPGMATGLADIAAAPISVATGVNRPVSRAADWIGEQTGFQPGKWAEDANAEYSPAMQQAQQNVEQAKGFLPTIGAVVQNPRVAAQVVAESLPSTIAGGLLARGAMGAVAGAEKLTALRAAAGSADAAVANAARRELLKSGAIAAGIGEGAITAGQQMAQTGYDVDPALAAGTALGAGIGTGVIGGLSGRVAGSALGRRLGLSDIETSMAAGTLGENASKAGIAGAVKRIGAGVVQEGLLEEAPQSYQEQVWQNIAAGKQWNEGAAEAAALGAVAGGVMGGAVNAIPRTAQPAEQPPAVQPIAQELAAAARIPDPQVDPVAAINHPASGAIVKATAEGVLSGAIPPNTPATPATPADPLPAAVVAPPPKGFVAGVPVTETTPAAPGISSPVSAAATSPQTNQAEPAGVPTTGPTADASNQAQIAIPPAQGSEAQPSAGAVAGRVRRGIASAALPPLQYPQQTASIDGPLPQTATAMPVGRFGEKKKALTISSSQRQTRPGERYSIGKMADVLDLRKNATGWKEYAHSNNDGTTLVSYDGNVAIDFPSANKRSGTESLRAAAKAQAFAIDNPYSADSSPTPDATLVISPMFRKQTEQQPKKPARQFVQPPLTARDQPSETSVLPQTAAQMPVGKFGERAKGVEAKPTPDAEKYARIKAMPQNERSDEDISFANAYWRKQKEPETRAQEDAESARLTDENDTDGFAESKSKNPALRQRIRNALNRVVSSNGRIISRKALVRDAVKSGSTIAQRENQRSLLFPSGAHNTEQQLSKTAMDYAEFLITKRSAPGAEKPLPINAVDNVPETKFGDIKAAEPAVANVAPNVSADISPDEDLKAARRAKVEALRKKAKDKAAPKNADEAEAAIQVGNVGRELTGFMKEERDAKIKAEKVAAWRGQFAGNRAETIASGDISRSDYEKLGDLVYRGKLTAGRAVEMIESASKEGVLDAKVAADMVKRISAFPAAEAPELTPLQQQAVDAQHINGKEVEKATPAVIKEAVSEGAQNAGLDLRQAHAILLQQIDAAIASAPSEKDSGENAYVAFKISKDTTEPVPNTKAHLVEYRAKRAGSGANAVFLKKVDEAIAAAPQVSDAFVVFEVPGDGKFKITNTKERLDLFRKKIVSNAAGFRPPPKRQPYKSPLQKKPQAGTASDETIREMLQSGDLTAALELSKVVGRPLVFGTPSDQNDPPLVKTHSEPIVIKGFKLSVGRSVPFKKSSKALWSVTELESGAFIASGETKAAAEKVAAEYMAPKTQEELRGMITKMGERGKGASQADLESRWLKWAEEEEYRIDNAEAIQQKADKERADKAKSAVEKWKDLTGINAYGDPLSPPSMDGVLAGYVAADKLGNGDRFLDYVESALANDDGWQQKLILSRLNLIRTFRGDGWSYDMAGSDAGRQRVEFEATSDDGRKISAGINVEKDLASGFVREDGIIKAKVGIDDSLTVVEARKQADKAIAALMKPAKKDPALTKDIPETVKDMVSWNVTKLRDIEKSLEGVERARGKGHILALELRDRQQEISKAQEKLATFRQMAKDKGVDADGIIANLGGEPDFDRFGRPAPADEPQSRIVMPDSLNLLRNPVGNGDTVRFADGSEWVAKTGWTGGPGAWTLLQGRKQHPTIKGIDGQAEFIRAIAEEEDRLRKPAPVAEPAPVTTPVVERETTPDATQDPLSGLDMSGLQVTVKAVQAETGKAVSFKTDAAEAIADVDKRIEFARNLLKCLAS